MSDPFVVYRAEAFYIPLHQVTETLKASVEERFTHRIYLEKVCEKCPYREDRHSENCDVCDAFKGTTATGGVVEKNGKPYLKIPRGGRGFLVSALKALGKYSSLKMIDKRPLDSPHSKKIKFIGTPRDYQLEPIEKVSSSKGINGVLKQPARSGKCLVGSTLITTNFYGIISLEDLFKSYRINLTIEDEQIKSPGNGLSVLTKFGYLPISFLYTKVVDATYRIELENGSTVEGTPIHPMLVKRCGQNPKWVSLSEVRVGDKFVQVDSSLTTIYVEVIDTCLKIEPTRVFDIEVPVFHEYIANGFISHNTVVATAIVCRLGQKTLILAAQTEWLSQFYETFVGSETATKFTNIDPERIGFPRKYEDFHKFDVCLCTLSMFKSTKGMALLKRVKNMFPLVIIDEVHYIPAKASARVVANINARWIVGLTGTTERKIQSEYKIAQDLVGKNLVEIQMERARPKVSLLRMPGYGTKDYQIRGVGSYAFTSLMTRLETSTPRRLAIIREAIRLVKEENHMVLIPLTRVNAILDYVTEINALMGPKFAMPFHGGIKKGKARMDIIEAARNYECKILVGNISLLSVGLNIPRASAIIECGLNNNPPACKQRIARILTPMDDKPQPKIVFTLDDSDVMRKCRRSEWFNTLRPEFNPIITEDVTQDLSRWFASETSKVKSRKGNFSYINPKTALR